MAEKTQPVRIFELVEGGRIHSEFFIEELDAALVLRASVDQHLFFLALCFKGKDRHLAVEHDSDECRKNEDDQQGRTALGCRVAKRELAGPVASLRARIDFHCSTPTSAGAGAPGLDRSFASGSSGSGLPCLSWVSSTLALVAVSSTIMYLSFTTSPSDAIRMLSPSRKKPRLFCPVPMGLANP